MRPDYSGREKEYYHAFVDGSWFSPRHVGVGGLIYQPFEQSLTADFSFRLPTNKAISSSAAEIYAAAEALKRIPYNSLVIVYSDFLEISRRLKELEQHLSSEDPTKLKSMGEAYTDLFNAISKHEYVQVIYARESSAPQMKIVHSLAQSAALEAPPMESNKMPVKFIQPTLHKKRTSVSRAERRHRDIARSIEQDGYGFSHPA